MSIAGMIDLRLSIFWLLCDVVTMVISLSFYLGI